MVDADELLRISLFYDVWIPYRRSPTDEALAAVLRRATEIILSMRSKRAKKARLAAAKTTNSGPPGAAAPAAASAAAAAAAPDGALPQVQGQRGLKRQDRGSAGSSTAKPPAKQPREEQPSTSQAVPPPPPAAEEAVETGQELTSTEMAVDLEPTTYAAKAKSDPKTPSLVLKVTLKGDRPRALSRELWQTFDRRLTNHLMDQERDDTPPPPVCFEWVSYYKGMGLFCAKNMEQRAFLQAIVSQVKVADYEFQAWSREEIRDDYIALRIPQRYRDRAPGSLYASIMRANPIAVEDLQVESCELRSPESGERLLRLRISREALLALKERGGVTFSLGRMNCQHTSEGNL